jgi:hypothetical protein
LKLIQSRIAKQHRGLHVSAFGGNDTSGYSEVWNQGTIILSKSAGPVGRTYTTATFIGQRCSLRTTKQKAKRENPEKKQNGWQIEAIYFFLEKRYLCGYSDFTKGNFIF